MKVVIRADASVWIGSGHIMRCLALATELERAGYQVLFACLPQSGDLIPVIESRGFRVTLLKMPLDPEIPSDSADYLSWLQRPVLHDAADFVEAIKNADLVVTDHYAIGREWQGYVKAELSCKILAIDDLLREHNADIILDQTLGRKCDSYTLTGKVLTGADYALINRNFIKSRELVELDADSVFPSKVLVSMGGIDQPNATLMVLESLVLQQGIAITVVLSSNAPHHKKVAEFCRNHNNITHLDFVDNMAEVISMHQLAVGAPGTSSLERACLGIPSVIIPLAENQMSISAELVRRGAALCIQMDEISEKLNSCLSLLLKDWLNYRERNLILCDGLGVFRVCWHINQLMTHKDVTLDLELQRADRSNIRLVYEWQSHPNTREHSLNSAVPSWGEHNQWMQKKLCSVSDFFYMIRDNQSNTFLGVVRLDKQSPNNYLVSIFVAPNNYGRGIGRSSLAILDSIHPHVILHATVLGGNSASQKLFEAAGYIRVSPEQFIRQPIQLKRKA